MRQDSQELVEELNAEAAVAFDGGRTNHLGDLACSIVSIVTSAAATVLAGSDAPGWITAIVAALSGLGASLQRVIDFRGRATWYFIKAAQLRNISLNLKYAAMPIADAAKQFGEIDKTMEERWSAMVKGGTPQAPERQGGGDPI